ncbi:MerR family transcriptional regulator [Clostridium aciditolerans]|uniref:MerR family transcriptional regulator n=1 Tax=Clostridium aciditolerans TaxID=339861 RepID=A0A934M2E9_9CLOT|nr:MerR family transcriptional regulator [Clostridium aciditolerans]MBI6871860.1 MerR family transcriptional regulator [Clostridium aciditolerans]
MKNKYLIGEVSNFFNISKDALRYYDKFGLITPKKDELNGYRYYTEEDIVKLPYLISLKELDMPLEEIKLMLYHKSLREMTSIFKNQENVIDNKIKKLEKIKNTIIEYEEDFNKAINYINKFEIVENPLFIYKVQNYELDENMINILKEFNPYANMLSIKYSVILNTNCFDELKLGENMNYAISGISTNDTEDIVLENNCKRFKKRKCIYTVIKAENDIKADDLTALQDYLSANNIQVTDNILARALAFESVQNTSIDYYELWVPIDGNKKIP